MTWDRCAIGTERAPLRKDFGKDTMGLSRVDESVRGQMPGGEQSFLIDRAAVYIDSYVEQSDQKTQSPVGCFA